MLYFFLLGFFILFGLGYFFAVKLLNFLVVFFSSAYQLKLIAISPYDTLVTILRLDMLLVSVIAVPLLLIYGIIYISPALYAKEKKLFWYLPGMFILAFIGLASGWLISTKFFVPYLQTFAKLVNIQNIWSITELISFIIAICLMFVGALQMPIVFTLLVNFKVIKLDKAAALRKTAIVLALIIAALVTPQTDPFSQLTVAVPFYLLFEVTLQYSLVKQKFKK